MLVLPLYGVFQCVLHSTLTRVLLWITSGSPSKYKEKHIKRVIALPGDRIQIPNSYNTIKIPDGYCWVEGDNSASTLDSRSFGPIPLGLIQGRATHIVWPLQRFGKVEQKMPEGRLGPY
ncbi:hypothetical protein MKX01_018840 [Papaver californicum]|nr:hypothetical protein MKX01_018840 [Papaver californicum]